MMASSTVKTSQQGGNFQLAQFPMGFPYPETEAYDVSTIHLVLHSDSGGQSRTIAIDHMGIVF